MFCTTMLKVQTALFKNLTKPRLSMIGASKWSWRDVLITKIFLENVPEILTETIENLIIINLGNKITHQHTTSLKTMTETTDIFTIPMIGQNEVINITDRTIESTVMVGLDIIWIMVTTNTQAVRCLKRVNIQTTIQSNKMTGTSHVLTTLTKGIKCVLTLLIGLLNTQVITKVLTTTACTDKVPVDVTHGDKTNDIFYLTRWFHLSYYSKTPFDLTLFLRGHLTLTLTLYLMR
jgi:hypothetical protein